MTTSPPLLLAAMRQSNMGMGVRPIVLAVVYQRVRALPVLVQACPEDVQLQSWRDKDRNGLYPIHHAAVGRDVRILEVVYEGWPDGVRMITADGETPLFIACEARRSENVARLVSWWPEAARVPTSEGTYPIHCAAFYPDTAPLQCLLQADPSTVWLRDDHQGSVLQVAQLARNTAGISLLLRAMSQAKKSSSS